MSFFMCHKLEEIIHAYEYRRVKNTSWADDRSDSGCDSRCRAVCLPPSHLVYVVGPNVDLKALDASHSIHSIKGKKRNMYIAQPYIRSHKLCIWHLCKGWDCFFYNFKCTLRILSEAKAASPHGPNSWVRWRRGLSNDDITIQHAMGLHTNIGSQVLEMDSPPSQRERWMLGECKRERERNHIAHQAIVCSHGQNIYWKKYVCLWGIAMFCFEFTHALCDENESSGKSMERCSMKKRLYRGSL